MTDGFRIGHVVIEGFKGFTTRKEIDFQNRHAFLLGRNGNGKSSIIEAIRWGLFGSTGRPNDIVNNQGYSGACRVEIILTRNGKEWRLRRSLIRGVSGGSDAKIVDQQGQEHHIRDIMPQLDSLNAGEGTHIIFASQSAPLRRQPEDLTPFERTVFNHLGLTHPRVLLSYLNNFLSDHERTECDLSERLTSIRKQIDDETVQLEHRRGRILAASPWGGDQPPTVAESEKKTTTLLETIIGQSLDPSLSGISLGALIEKAREHLQNKGDQEQGAQRVELDKVCDHLRRLQDIDQTQKDAESQKSKLDDAQERLDMLLDSKSLDDLRKSAETARHEADTAALKHRLAVDSLAVLRRDKDDLIVSCPVCAKEHHRKNLESVLSSTAGKSPDDDSSHLHKLDEQIQQAEKIADEIQVHSDHLKELSLKLQSLIDADGMKDLAISVSDDKIEEAMKSLAENESSIAAKIEDKGKWIQGMSAKLSKLEEEEQYHQTQKDLHNLGKVKVEFQRADRAFKDFVSLGESVRDIRDVVESCLTEQLREKTPGVESQLTQVFKALTLHPHYDRLIIDKEHLPRLKLQVSSSHDPGGVGHATGVLNGQAESALALVPYFALSQANETPTEVYLVLLDDPTRAFDGEHIEILIERLAELGRHVQIIVASQETTPFRKLLPKNFERSSYVVVEPKNWSYAHGPELAPEYE